MAIFDIIVITAIGISGLIGFITGFVRGGLFVVSWFGSMVVTVYAFPYAKPVARENFGGELMTDLATAGAIFLVALIFLHLISHVVGERVRRSRLNALDRSLGLLAGLVTPMVILCLAYLVVIDSMPEEWLEEARTQSLVEQGAVWLRSVLPDDLREQSDELLRDGRGALHNLNDALPPAQLLLEPRVEAAPPGRQGYSRAERLELDGMLRERR